MVQHIFVAFSFFDSILCLSFCFFFFLERFSLSYLNKHGGIRDISVVLLLYLVFIRCKLKHLLLPFHDHILKQSHTSSFFRLPDESKILFSLLFYSVSFHFSFFRHVFFVLCTYLFSSLQPIQTCWLLGWLLNAIFFLSLQLVLFKGRNE